MTCVQRFWYSTRLGHWLYERQAERDRLADFRRRLDRIAKGNQRYVYRRAGKWPAR